MSIHKSIPTRAVGDFKFLREIDFPAYRKLLPAFEETAGLGSIPRIVSFIPELIEAQEVLTSSLTNSIYIKGEEGVGKSMIVIALLNKVALGEASPTLLAKHYFTFEQHAFFTLPTQDQVLAFDAAINHLSKKNSVLILDRLDDFVANCGPERSRRLMSSLIDGLDNERVSAIVSSQSCNHGQIDETSTLFSRYFRELTIRERNGDESRAILRQMTPQLERKHRVVIGEDVINEVIRLDQSYEGRLKGRNPTRVIDFLDQLAASINLAKYGKSKEVLEHELALVQSFAEERSLHESVRPNEKRIAAVSQTIAGLKAIVEPELEAWNSRFGAIQKMRYDLSEIQEALSPLQERYESALAWQKDKRGDPLPSLSPDEMRSRDIYLSAEKKMCADLAAHETEAFADVPHVTADDVRERFAKMTGVSAKAASANDAERLLGIEAALSQSVFGQEHAKKTLADIYRTRETGTSDPAKPAGVVLLTGGPGCGKTELVKSIAAYDGRLLIYYNMNLYTEASSVSRLIGAAPGLVGFGQVVTLPDAVRAQPKSVVFFDELEKAHGDLHKTLMQIMDDGMMPDSMNVSVYFKDCIIVFASNILRRADLRDDEATSDELIRAKLAAAIDPKTGKPAFLPEFIGRIDAVEVFDDITPDIARMILDKELRSINNGIVARGYRVEAGPTVCGEIIEHYFDPTQGGRSIRQLSKKILRPLVTDRLLRRQAREAPPEDDETRPMRLEFIQQRIVVDGDSA